MSLPIAATGPLNVLMKPILSGCWARAGAVPKASSATVPIYRDIGVSKVQNLPLAPWKRLGGKGTYIQLHGTEGKWGSYVVEVPGADALKAEKHLYEEIYLVVEGRGTTEVWLDSDSKRH